MKYFLDTEFIEDGKTIDLISIGIVSEEGKEFYLENSECNLNKASNWVHENVIPNLIGPRGSREFIAKRLLDFFKDDPAIQIWGYFSDYDWVVFCQLFGRMIDIPRIFPHFCLDIKQEIKLRGLNIKQENSNHNALDDAKWIKDTYFKIFT